MANGMISQLLSLYTDATLKPSPRAPQQPALPREFALAREFEVVVPHEDAAPWIAYVCWDARDTGADSIEIYMTLPGGSRRLWLHGPAHSSMCTSAVVEPGTEFVLVCRESGAEIGWAVVPG